jgi:hypothetical protein
MKTFFLLPPKRSGGWKNQWLVRESVSPEQASDFIEVVEKAEYDKTKQELEELKAERQKIASGKLACADCGAVLARW